MSEVMHNDNVYPFPSFIMDYLNLIFTKMFFFLSTKIEVAKYHPKNGSKLLLLFMQDKKHLPPEDKGNV